MFESFSSKKRDDTTDSVREALIVGTYVQKAVRYVIYIVLTIQECFMALTEQDFYISENRNTSVYSILAQDWA